MPNPDIIGIGPWLPDTPAISRQPPASTEALNVVARSESYGPFPSFLPTSTGSELDMRAQGSISVRRTDQVSVVYVGTLDKLYQLTGSGNPVDVSRLGAPYSCPQNGFWSFAQFGDLVVAFNGFDAPQVINIDSGTSFAALGGSPPLAKYVAVVGDFLMAGNAPTLDHVVYWSAINNAADWVTSQVTQADNQPLPDGGQVTGIIGIEYTATIFQEFAIRRAVYEGPPDIFRFSVVTPNLGCSVPGSIVNYKDMIFFLDRAGFFLLQGLGVPQPIGEQQVNRWFWANVNQNFLYRICGAVDVTNATIWWLFPDLLSEDGTPNHMIGFCWTVGRWTHAQPGNIEFIYTASPSGGWTIEEIAAVYPDVEDMPYPWDSPFWQGVARRLIGGFNTSHQFGYFNGTPLAATVDTVEANLVPGRMAFVRSVRPLLDSGGDGLSAGPACSISLITRNLLSDQITITNPVQADSFGLCKFRNKARYHRARALIPASANWSDFLGVDDITVRDAGFR